MQKYINNVQDTLGNAIGSVTVTIRDNPGGGLSTIYSDNSLTGKSNPFTNDSDGEFFFYAANGRYDIELTGPITTTNDDIRLLDIVGGAGNDTPFDIIGDINMATPPVAAAFTGQLRIVDNDETDVIATFGYDGDAATPLYIRNLVTNGRIIFEADEFSGTPTEVLRLYGGRGAVAHLEAYAMANRLIANYIGTIAFSPEDPPLMVTAGAGEDGSTAPYLGIWDTYIQSYTAGAAAGNGLWINNEGGNVVIGSGAGGSGGDVTLQHDGWLRLKTFTTAIYAFNLSTTAPSGGTVGADVKYELATRSQSAIARMGVRASDDVAYLGHDIHGQSWIIEAQNSSGAVWPIANFNPDTGVKLYYANVVKLQTADETASAAASGAEVLGPDSVMRFVGFNELPRQAISGSNHTLAQDDQGKTLFYDEATARSLLFNNDSAIPVDAFFHYRVGPTGGVLTGDGGTGVTISWWNGTSYTTTSAAGNITIGEGAGTIWKDTATHYYIDGPNLS